jgi:dienelactone hydrolase
VREPGIWGLFARPAGAGPFPGVVCFGGSSGGLGPAAAWAPVLASHGFATLAIAYFGVPGLPAALAGIEVEVVERAAAWLLGRTDVGGDRVAVVGMSRGSELALLAGVLLDRVSAVVGFAPSGVCWAGLGPGGPMDAPAWTYRGDPVRTSASAACPRPGSRRPAQSR